MTPRAWLMLSALLSSLSGSVCAQAAEKRPLPNYDGRAKRTTPGEVALWVPRILLFPAYVVSEYVIRRPLGFLVAGAERAQLPAVLYNVFLFGPEHSGGVVPTAFVDFGFAPSVGLYAFWDNAGFKGHDLRLRGSTWGADWLSARVTERFRLDEKESITLTASGVRRPDYTFYGVGANSREADVGRYSRDTVDARGVFRAALFGAGFVEASAGYRSAFFRSNRYLDDPGLSERVPNAYPEPEFFQSGYRAAFSGFELVLDSRERQTSNSGVRLDLQTEQGTNLQGSQPSGWVRYGGTAGVFVDLTDTARVLGLSLSTSFADPRGTREVPFTELVQLGGANLMPGFREGRLAGRSAAVATLRYSWPIWIWLNGSLQTAVGNVFGTGLAGASLGQSRFSGAIGIEGTGSRDSVFQLLVGSGTDTFDNGAGFNSIRITAGARSGF